MPLNAWDVASVIAKAVTYAVTLGAAGGVFFLRYSDSLLLPQDCLQIRRLVGILIAAAVPLTCARVAVLAGSMSGEIAGMFDGTMVSMLIRAGEGRGSGLRIAGLLLASITVFSKRRPSALAVMGAGMAAISFAAVGHAEAVARPAVPILLVSVHLLCVAFWLGALGPLWLIARGADLPHLAHAAARFGNAAVVVVTLLIAAGVALLSLLIRSASQLWTSGYGRMLLLKLALVACLLGIAAFNKLRLTPRLRLGDAHAAQSLRSSITIEMLLSGFILIATATFTTLMGPPR